MNKDEEEYFRRKFSVESDRELDNLADIPSNLDTSLSTIASPTHRVNMLNFRGSRPGMSQPPHHGGGRDDDEPTDEEEPGTSDVVRKLKSKTVRIADEGDERGQNRMSETLPDARTPRYNMYTDYNAMEREISSGDPFGGEYVPSGKAKKSKKQKKHRQHESKIPLPVGGLNDDYDMPSGSSSKKHKKKKKRHSDSKDSTATFTISGHTNPSYNENSVDLSEAASVNSNGTYTVQKADSKPKPRPPLRRLDTNPSIISNANSITLKRTLSTKRKTNHGVDKEALQSFIKEANLEQREPKGPVTGTIPGMDMDRFEKSKTLWNSETHSVKVPCNSYGMIQFHGYGHDTDASPYVRVSQDTKADVVMRILLDHWKLPTPKLLISVTGGAKRFDLKPKLLDKFKKGLINAATSTGAWIITGGTQTGVMEMVGEGVKEHAITFGRADDIIALGVTTWGCVANRNALDGNLINPEGEEECGLFPAVYSKHDVQNEPSKKTMPLDHNHSHFILVDDGSVEKFGGEIEFRSNLERHISHILCDSAVKAQDMQVNIPVIQIIIEGGIGSMKTVHESVKNGIPVLVLSGTGRAADFIAKGYDLTRDIFNEDRSTFPQHYKEVMEELATNGFEWKPGETNKPAKIATCLQQLKETLLKRKMLSVVDLMKTDNKEFEKAILNALLKANKSHPGAQLSLALAWNRSDIAKNEIFSSKGKINKDMKLNDAMMTALIQNKRDFVDLFMENGVELTDFLDIKNLWNLYANTLKSKSDSSAMLLNNLIMYLNQTWGAYLCCRPVENLGYQPQLLRMIGKAIVHLLGNEALNPYSEDKYEVQGETPKLGYILNAEATNSARGRKKGDKEGEDIYCLDDPSKQLMIWALLMNRTTLSKLFWKIGKDHLGGALFACSLLKAMSNLADDEEEMDLSISYMQHANVFENLAVQVVSQCYSSNKVLSHQLLVRQLKRYGNTTLLMLADENELMDFMDHAACQTKLNIVWKGRMALYTSSLKIIACMVLPFLIPTIKFTSNKNPAEHLEETEETDFDELEKSEIVEKEGQSGNTNKVSPEVNNKRKSFLKKKLYKVNLIGGEGNSISVFAALYYFYTAPVTKFSYYTIAYLVYLSLFTFFVLTNLHPISHVDSPGNIEIITWIWTLTMVTEEVRQVLTKDQRSFVYKVRSWFANIWNKFDLIMYVMFILSVILRFSLGEKDFVWARMFYSITLAMYYLRFMQTFFAEKNIGPKVIMIRRMITDLMFFFAILAVFVVSFGIAYQANLFPNAPADWSLLKQVVYLPYWQMYGELFIENMEGEEPAECTYNETLWRSGAKQRCAEKNALVPILLAVYMLLTNILLVNLLIAMFSDTFQKVQDNSLKVWRFFRFSLVYEYYERPSIFPPFIILNHIFRAVRWIIHKCTSTLGYHDDFKLKLDDRDDYQLTLFERKAVDEYLHTAKLFEREQLESKVTSTAERLENVMDELDNIKESILNQEKKPLENGDDVMRSEVVPLTSRSSGISVTTPSVQDQLNQLSAYVKDELSHVNDTVSRLEELLNSKILFASTKSSGSPTVDIDPGSNI